jgi:5-methylcytosine-specific restriction endonuclease McrA
MNASLDHKIPKCLGGGDNTENLQWVTLDVNTAKWDRTEEQFLELCGKIVAYTKK